MCGIAGQIEYQRGLWEQAEIWSGIQAALRRRERARRGCTSPPTPCWPTPGCASSAQRAAPSPWQAAGGERACTLVYSGELYNTDELRRELSAAGWNFQTHSDTEAVLKAYMAWGACPEKFNGNFALAIWEAETETLFIARGHMGVKPLFYASPTGGAFFSPRK